MRSAFWDGFRLGMYQAAFFGGATFLIVGMFMRSVHNDWWLALLLGAITLMGALGWGVQYDFAWRPPSRECSWCRYLRSIGATEAYIAEQHAWADEEYGGHES